MTDDPMLTCLSVTHEADSGRNLAALVQLIAYARDEAERLDAPVLVFCLDASLSVARRELLQATDQPAKAGGRRPKLSMIEPKRLQ